jgi:hypothetical protein
MDSSNRLHLIRNPQSTIRNRKPSTYRGYTGQNIPFFQDDVSIGVFRIDRQH